MTRTHSNATRPIVSFSNSFCAGGFQASSDPVEIIAAYTLGDVLPAIRKVEAASKSGRWAAGFVSYEAVPAFDPALTAHTAQQGFPLVWFAVFDGPQKVSSSPGEYQVGEWASTVPASDYESGFSHIRNAIADGLTYQVNYTFPLEASFQGDPFGFFRVLQSDTRAAYSAFIDTGRFQIVSASPELFFARNGDEIVLKPMKGTSPRAPESGQDERCAELLKASDKNRAENVMIVDLMRSDIGRISRTGTVEVVSLFDVERLPTVWQMTSTVRAVLQQGTGLADLFRALFPCGSVTGAPKASTMRIINEIEPNARGVYCGAIGLVAPGGDATFSVGIRTVVIDQKHGTARCGVGGGITWGSEVRDEYQEALAKSVFLTHRPPVFELLETIALKSSQFQLLERHLDRLSRSASYFGYQCDRDAVVHALGDVRSQHATDDWRVRLLVSADGTARTEAFALPPMARATWKVAFARSPVSSADPFLYHKTTHRSVYETHRKENPDTQDVILWNERDEVTEFTIGNIVIERDGEKLTPPIACGLLAGTMRDELIEQGEIAEAVLSRADVETAERIWLINSVRGWIPVMLAR